MAAEASMTVVEMMSLHSNGELPNTFHIYSYSSNKDSKKAYATSKVGIINKLDRPM